MGALLQIIAGFFTGKAAEQIGAKVARGAEIAALVAALAPVALWLQANKDDAFIVITYGQLAFWGGIVGALVFFIVRLTHRAPPPQ